MNELVQYLKEETMKWPGASVVYRTDWACEYFSIEQKCFAMLGQINTGDWVMTVKGLPEENELLRTLYADVIAGYYANKVHWNSFLLKDSSFTKEQLAEFLKASYGLVLKKLPKKVQQRYSCF